MSNEPEIQIDEVTPLTEEQWERIIKWHHKRTGREIMQEMYGSWLAESDEERKLRELAETYHTGCEAYDRRVCTGISPRTGEAMPMNSDEMRLINRHALQMRGDMIAEGERFGFTARQVEEAIRKYVPTQQAMAATGLPPGVPGAPVLPGQNYPPPAPAGTQPGQPMSGGQK